MKVSIRTWRHWLLLGVAFGKAGAIEVTIDTEQNSIFSGKMGQKNGQYAVNIERNVEKK